MRKMCYLGYQTIQRMMHIKAHYLLYIVSFYIGLLLPVFCIANYSFLKDRLEFYVFDGMDNSVQIDWFSSSFQTTDFDGLTGYSMKAMYQEVVSDWDNYPILVEGIEKNYFYKMPSVKGRALTNKEMDQGDAVCLLDMASSKKYNCDVGDMVQINDHNLKVVGVITNSIIRNHIIIPLGMVDKIYREKGETIQYSGTFMMNEKQDANQLISLLSSMIKEKDEHAKILFSAMGEETHKQAIQSVAQWKVLRAFIALGVAIFFLINEMIIIIGKLQKDKKAIAIKMALGISSREIGICYLIETICIIFVADLLVFLTITPLAKVFSLDEIILFDPFVVIVTLIGSLGISAIISLGVMHTLKKKQISSMLTMEDE